jgi:hypothetical protein
MALLLALVLVLDLLAPVLVPLSLVSTLDLEPTMP